MKMNFNDPEDICRDIPDVAGVTITPMFGVIEDTSGEKNTLIITLELFGRAKEHYQAMNIQILTSVRNEEHHEKCCIYEYVLTNIQEEIPRYEADVGYNYELEFFEKDGAILECEVCFRLPVLH